MSRIVVGYKDGVYIPILTSMGESVLTHPLDVIRIRFTNRTNVWRGIRGIYSGLTYKVIGLIPNRIVFLGGNTIAKKNNIDFLTRSIVLGTLQSCVDLPFLMWRTSAAEGIPFKFNRLPRGLLPLIGRNTIFAIGLFGSRDLRPFQNYYYNTLIGCVIGVCMSQPLEVIRTQKQSIQKDMNLYNITKKIYGSYGVYGFWRGVFPRGGIAIVSFLTLSFLQSFLEGQI